MYNGFSGFDIYTLAYQVVRSFFEDASASDLFRPHIVLMAMLLRKLERVGGNLIPGGSMTQIFAGLFQFLKLQRNLLAIIYVGTNV